MKQKQKHFLQKNIIYLMESHGFSDLDVASKSNMPISTVRRLIYSEDTNPTASSLIPISDMFNISIDDLLKENISETGYHRGKFEIPLLTINQIEEWIASSLDINCIKKFISSDCNDDKSYSIRVDFPVGDVQKNRKAMLVISPSFNPVHGDFIVILKNSETEPSVVELFLDCGKYFYTDKKSNEKIPLVLPFSYLGRVVDVCFDRTSDANKAENLISAGQILAPFMLDCKV